MKKKITKIEQLTENVWAFCFKKDFSFLPGQYVEITFPAIKSFPTRELTIASSPLEKDFFRIVTKKGYTDFKKKLFSLKVGDEVEISGPKGGFILDEKEKGEKIFLCGGLGITPFYSMITYAQQKNVTFPLTLIATFSKKSDFLFYKEIQTISEKFPSIHYQFFDIRISKETLKKYISHFSEKLFYIAGPNGMIDDTQTILQTLGVKDTQIRIEYYNGYEIVD